jgi:hypothetical protein
MIFRQVNPDNLNWVKNMDGGNLIFLPSLRILSIDLNFVRHLVL